MPSISGPRSTVASSLTVTPFVSGPVCLSLIVLSLLQTQPLTFRYIGGAQRRSRHPFVNGVPDHFGVETVQLRTLIALENNAPSGVPTFFLELFLGTAKMTNQHV